jgi:leader peptidase (prepilin peptidase)/N-methyltransferase
MSSMSLGEVIAMLPGWFPGVAAFTFGLLWGSFLNVVIYRVPRELSVVRPASRCPGCGTPIAGYDNIPVLSYVILRGRARCCGARMSPRYPLVELIGGALSLAVWLVLVEPLPASTSFARAIAIYGAYFALALGLVAAAFIDAEHMFLPDSIMFGGMILGIATATIRGMALSDAVVSAIVGFVVIWLPFIFLYKGLLGRTGMGLGDAKLLALAGAWLSWPGALFVLLAGAVQGTLYAGALKLFGIEPALPEAVREEIAELEKAAAEGDEEAKKALAEDPLTEDEDDAFLVRFFRRLIHGAEGAAERERAAREAEEKERAAAGDEGDDEPEPPRARIPFGPFLILALLEYVFARDLIERFFALP